MDLLHLVVGCASNLAVSHCAIKVPLLLPILLLFLRFYYFHNTLSVRISQYSTPAPRFTPPNRITFSSISDRDGHQIALAITDHHLSTLSTTPHTSVSRRVAMIDSGARREGRGRGWGWGWITEKTQQNQNTKHKPRKQNHQKITKQPETQTWQPATGTPNITHRLPAPFFFFFFKLLAILPGSSIHLPSIPANSRSSRLHVILPPARPSVTGHQPRYEQSLERSIVGCSASAVPDRGYMGSRHGDDGGFVVIGPDAAALWVRVSARE